MGPTHIYENFEDLRIPINLEGVYFELPKWISINYLEVVMELLTVRSIHCGVLTHVGVGGVIEEMSLLSMYCI